MGNQGRIYVRKFGVTKIEVLKLLNQEWEYKGSNSFLKAISHEFRKLQNLYIYT